MWQINYPVSNLVARHRGTLPVLIACAHDGNAAPEGVPERTGRSTPSGCYFEKARDRRTREVALGVAQRLLDVFGEAPYVVSAEFHRKYIDANRSRRCGFEVRAAKAFYDEYHATLHTFIDDIRADNDGIGLLFDIHGTAGIAADPADIYLGTANGATVARLLTADPGALWRRRSLRGFLEAAGHAVSPKQPGAPETPALSGGFTVKTYGSSNADGIDAFQVEITTALRTDAVRRQALIEHLAYAIGNLVGLWADSGHVANNVAAERPGRPS